MTVEFYYKAEVPSHHQRRTELGVDDHVHIWYVNGSASADDRITLEHEHDGGREKHTHPAPRLP